MAKGRRLVGNALLYRRPDHVFDEGKCYSKTKWASEKSAQRAVTRLRRDFPESFDSLVRPYRCSACKRWHIGHGV